MCTGTRVFLYPGVKINHYYSNNQAFWSRLLVKNTVLLLLPPAGFSDEGFRFMKQALSEKNVKLAVASSSSNLITGLGGTKVQPEIPLYQVHASNFAGLLITGGEGWLKTDIAGGYSRVVNAFYSSKKLIGAVCSGPVVLAKSGILTGLASVCNPLYKQELIKAGANFIDKEYVISGKIITGRDAAALPSFALNYYNLLKTN